MALETGTYISDLVATNPVSGDPKSQGDDHIRLLKSTIKATFPNVNAAVTPTDEELNFVDGVTSNIQTQLDAKAPLASPVLTGVPEAPTPADGDNSTKIATTAFVVNASLTSSLPGQSGNAGKLIGTDGTTAGWVDEIDTSIVKPAAGDEFVTESQTQTLSNKTITDPIFVNDADNTKEAVLNVSGVTAGQSRVMLVSNNDLVLDTPGWRLLSVINASNVATVDIETTFDSAYDDYVIVASEIASVSTSKLRCRLKIGGSYLTSSTYAYSQTRSTNSTTYDNSNGTTFINLMGDIDGTAAANSNFVMFIHNPASTTKYKTITWRGMHATGVVASSWLNVSGSAYNNSSTAALTGVRIYMESLNIYGKFKLFGIRNSI